MRQFSEIITERNDPTQPIDQYVPIIGTYTTATNTTATINISIPRPYSSQILSCDSRQTLEYALIIACITDQHPIYTVGSFDDKGNYHTDYYAIYTNPYDLCNCTYDIDRAIRNIRSLNVDVAVEQDIVPNGYCEYIHNFVDTCHTIDDFNNFWKDDDVEIDQRDIFDVNPCRGAADKFSLCHHAGSKRKSLANIRIKISKRTIEKLINWCIAIQDDTLILRLSNDRCIIIDVQY